MLDRYIGECMVSLINNNHASKESNRGYPNCNINQLLIFIGCVKVREFLYTRVIIWFNIILNHIVTSII